MAYTIYSHPIDCTVDDKVLVYKKDIFNKNGSINKDMIGIVKKIEQYEYEDAFGSEYLSYRVEIKMKNGEIIVIKDNKQKTFFRRHEFITLKDLNNLKKISTIR